MVEHKSYISILTAIICIIDMDEIESYDNTSLLILYLVLNTSCVLYVVIDQFLSTLLGCTTLLYSSTFPFRFLAAIVCI